MGIAQQENEELVHEHEGLLWKPVERCTSTFEEFVAAQERWMEIFHETRWNPWRKDTLRPEADRARDVMHEWTRAEPDHRMMTEEEIASWMAEMDREFEARHAADEARWVQDRDRYSPEQEKARYALLEREAIRSQLARDLEGYRFGAQSPGVQADIRAKKITELEADTEHNEHEILKLSAIVGDPEDVVDADGRLPSDRRPLHLVGYDVHRRFEVEDLHTSIAAQREKIVAAHDRKAKTGLEASLWRMERRLKALLAVPRLTAEEMCSDCETPAYQHTSGGAIYESRPCPWWPMHAARMEHVWELLRSVAERDKPAEPQPAKRAPLATLPGTLPIAEVIERLKELQAEHPTAIVKRGRANRWELWPADA